MSQTLAAQATRPNQSGAVEGPQAARQSGAIEPERGFDRRAIAVYEAEAKRRSRTCTVRDPDLPGGFLRISPSANGGPCRTVYVVRADRTGGREGRKQVKRTLGRIDERTIPTFRELARNFQIAIATGEDPDSGPLGPTVADLYPAFLDDVFSGKGSESGARQRWEAYISKHFGGMTLDRLTTREVNKFNSWMTDEEGKPSAADSSINNLGSFQRWLVKKGYVENRLFERPRKNGSTPRDSVFENESLARLRDHLKAHLDSESPSVMSLAALMVLYTGQRVGEVVSMRYSEIKQVDDELWWIRKAEDRKVSVPQAVWLGPVPVAILKAAYRNRFSKSELVFESPRKRGKPIATVAPVFSDAKKRLGLKGDIMASIARNSLAVLLRESLDHTQIALGHARKSVADRHYSRQAANLAVRRMCFESYHEYLETCEHVKRAETFGDLEVMAAVNLDAVLV